jgi:DNA polymerase III delta subunit
MILIIHGDHQSASREHLYQQIQRAKSKNYEIIKLKGKTLALNQLITSAESGSMFKSDKLLVIENFFSRPKSKEKQNIIDYLKKTKNLPHLIFWEPKSLPPTSLRIPGVQNKLFKLPVTIFKFLDNFHRHAEIPSNEPVELIFHLLHRRLAELIILKDDPSKLKKAPWQLNRLKSQANHFSLDQLIKLHAQLLEIDYLIKSGQSPHSLATHLDILLARI